MEKDAVTEIERMTYDYLQYLSRIPVQVKEIERIRKAIPDAGKSSETLEELRSKLVELRAGIRCVLPAWSLVCQRGR